MEPKYPAGLMSEHSVDLMNRDQIVSAFIYRAHVYHDPDAGYAPAVTRLQARLGHRVQMGTQIFLDLAFDQPFIAFALARWFAETMAEQHALGLEEWKRRQPPMEPYSE